MLGELLGGIADLYGGNKAANIERRATRKAGGYLDKGYGSALDLARPMQERAQSDYMNLSDRYGRGEFRSPDQAAYRAKEFSYDPNAVFNDPEYNASMRAGTQALESGAAGKGMLFSGNTGRALQEYGQNLFAKRSDELYNRARDEYQNNRDFDYTAQNRAYDTNASNRAKDYEMASGLASYAPEALDRSLNLNLGRAQAQADTELGVGGIRSDAWRSGGRKVGRGVNAAANYGEQFAPKSFKLGGG